MKNFNDTAADSSSIISVVSAVASISTTAQPIISAFAGLVGVHTFAGCEELYKNRFCEFNPDSSFCIISVV